MSTNCQQQIKELRPKTGLEADFGHGFSNDSGSGGHQHGGHDGFEEKM